MSEAVFVEGLTKTYYGKGDAEDRQLFPADTRTYDDEKHIFRCQHGKYSVTNLRDACTYHSVHRPCYSLLTLGIKRSKIFTLMRIHSAVKEVFMRKKVTKKDVL